MLRTGRHAVLAYLYMREARPNRPKKNAKILTLLTDHHQIQVNPFFCSGTCQGFRERCFLLRQPTKCLTHSATTASPRWRSTRSLEIFRILLEAWKRAIELASVRSWIRWHSTLVPKLQLGYASPGSSASPRSRHPLCWSTSQTPGLFP